MDALIQCQRIYLGTLEKNQTKNHTVETEKGNYTFIKENLPEIREKVNELERLQRLNESHVKQLLSLEDI